MNEYKKDNDRKAFELHDAVCASCDKHCQVPFKPSSGKPVKCRDCFAANKGGSRDSRDNKKPVFGSNRSDQSRPYKAAKDHSRELDEINTKLDRILNMLALGKETKTDQDRQYAKYDPSRKKEVDVDTLTQAVKNVQDTQTK